MILEKTSMYNDHFFRFDHICITLYCYQNKTTGNSTCPKGGRFVSKDSDVVAEFSDLRMKVYINRLSLG